MMPLPVGVRVTARWKQLSVACILSCISFVLYSITETPASILLSFCKSFVKYFMNRYIFNNLFKNIIK